MSWLRHVWLMLFQPWPRHMAACAFCAAAAPPEESDVVVVRTEDAADFVFLSGKRCRP